MYVCEFGFTDEKNAIAILIVFIVQMVLYCVLTGVQECGKN